MKTNLTCIICPMSCALTVMNQGDELIVSGNTCPRGASYALQEMINPVRTITSTVKITGAIYPRLPVITSKPVSKDQIFNVMSAINKIQVVAPINMNQIVLANVCGLGIDIVASRSMK